MYISKNRILVPGLNEHGGFTVSCRLNWSLIFPQFFFARMKALWFSCLKNINSSCKGNHHADRKREAYDPGWTAFKDCFILRSLEGDSSGCALDRSIAQLLTSDGREGVCQNHFGIQWWWSCAATCTIVLHKSGVWFVFAAYETDMNVIWGEEGIKGLISGAVAYQKASNWTNNYPVIIYQ